MKMTRLLCLASIGLIAARSYERITAAITIAVAFVINAFGTAQRPALEGFGGFAVPSTNPHYAEPAQSFLRHESHVSRRSADRHI